MSVRVSEMKVHYSARGIPTYLLELSHVGLRKHRVVKGNDSSIVQRKAQLQAKEWDDNWRAIELRESDKRKQIKRKETAEARTTEAARELRALEQLLAHTLFLHDALDWGKLKDHSSFPEPAPVSQENPSRPPSQVQLSLLDRLIRSRRERKLDEMERRVAQYNSAITQIERTHAERTKKWEKRRNAFLEEQHRANEAVEQRKALYLSKDSEAILDYCDLVLSNSHYPEWMRQEWELDLNAETGILIVDYALPSLDDMPTLSEVRYVKARDELTEKHISDIQKRKSYDSMLYQITLRTIHELFEADVVQALNAIVFNGMVTSIDRSTGHETTACILSVQAQREEFLKINLANVDPKACFKSLKGVGSSKLHSLTAIAPIIQMRREDGRFVSAREVADTLDDSINIAAMEWEDFEHLIREIFEQEFAAGGGEVKVTQASRDGGVDAIAFDPDPIRGGKIVIQAKRYTNTVGVAAVRDLYGTVMNEGANRGILVTTSDYGPDAYSFAREKPISLLNGANLLHLLQKHGHRAKIDIAEARRLHQEA